MIPAKYWSPTRKLMLLGAMAGGKAVEDTATGNPLTFLTDLARPLKSLLIPFTPKQEGTGDPSPENVRPIIGWNGMNVWNGGENLIDEATVSRSNRYIKYTSPTNAQWNASADSRSYKLEVEPNTTYTVRALNPAITTFRVCALEEGNLQEYSTNAFQWDGTGEKVCEITTSATEHYLIIQANKFVLEDRKGYIYVAEGTVAENHMTDTDIVFPSPVYGGYVDMVTGEVWATWEAIEKTWGELKIDRDVGGYREGRANFVNPIPVSGESGASATYQKCNIAKYLWQDFDGTAHFYTAKVGNNYRVSVYLPIDTNDSTEIVVVCKLKSPVLITTLTPTQITALVGNNTIWSDADGQMTAVYLKKG